MILAAKVQIVSQPFSIARVAVFRYVLLKQQSIKPLFYFGMNLKHCAPIRLNDNINFYDVIRLDEYVKYKNMTGQGKVFMILGYKPYTNLLVHVTRRKCEEYIEIKMRRIKRG